MATIADYLKKILSAVYGKDVRQAIHDAIHQCYEDGKVGAVDLIARERIDNLAKLQEGSTTGDAELIDIRVGFDGTIYENAGEAIRGQVSYLNSNFMTLQNVLLSKTKESAYKITDGYALKGDGTTFVSSSAHVAKYPVTFGEIIYIKVSANGYGTFQFSSTETATDIVGNPYSGDYDGFIEVPEGAAYVNICFFDGDEISGKYTAESKSSITQKQINALDSLFRVIAYSDKDVLNSEYKNFKEAFGLSSEDEPGDAGEGLLKNGSATFSNGATLTVSDGKHVSLYLPKKAVYQCYFNISDYEKNTTDTGSTANVDNQLPIYTLKKGDTVSISMYNIIVNGGNETYPGGYQEQMAINLRKANSNISCSTNNVSIHGGEAIEDKTSITEMESTEYVGALMLFVQNNSSDITIMFDIDVKVNGETIKWY